MYFNNLPQKVLLDSQGPCLACSSATALHDFPIVYLFSIKISDFSHKCIVGPSLVSTFVQLRAVCQTDGRMDGWDGYHMSSKVFKEHLWC